MKALTPINKFLLVQVAVTVSLLSAAVEPLVISRLGARFLQPAAITATNEPPARESWGVDPAFAPPNLFVDTPAAHVVRDARGGLVWCRYSPEQGVGADDTMVGELVRTFEDGRLDRDFRVGSDVLNSWAVASEPGGDLLAAVTIRGDLATNGAPNFRIARFRPDGRRDPAYRSPVLINGVRLMALDPRGRLIIPDQSGSVASLLVGNGGLGGTLRLGPNGAVDPDFHSPSVSHSAAAGLPFGFWAPPVFDSGGGIYLAGLFEAIDGHPATNLVRLLDNGYVDPAFVPRGIRFAFGSRAIVRSLAVQADGRVLVAGRAMRVDGRSGEFSLLRLLPSGEFDPTFAPSEAPRFLFALLDSRERLLASDGTTLGQPAVSRFLSDGRLDPAFVGPVAEGSVFFNWFAVGTRDEVILPNNQASHQFSGIPVHSATRVDPAGKVDDVWRGPRTMGLALVRGVQASPDGGLRVWGRIDRAQGRDVPSLIQFDGAGELRPASDDTVLPAGPLEVAGVPSLDGGLYVLAGGALLATNFVPLSIRRLMPNGSADPGFQPPASLFPEYARFGEYSLAAIGDDALIVRNIAQDVVDGAPWTRRLDPDGEVRASFSSPRRPVGQALYSGPELLRVDVGWYGVLGVLPDGRCVAGWSGDDGELNLFRLATLATNGTVERVLNVTARAQESTSTGYPEVLNPRTGVYTQVEARERSPSPNPPFTGAVGLSDGSLLIYGAFSQLDDVPVGGLARLTPEGDLDRGFGTVKAGARWSARPSDRPRVDAVLPAADGRLWVVGRFDTFNGIPAPGLVRLLPGGGVDTTFTSPIEFRDVGDLHRHGLQPGPDGLLWVTGPYARVDEAWPRLLHRLRMEGSEPRRRLEILRDPGGVRIEFDGTIEAAASVDGPWELLPGAVGPLLLPTDGITRFFRLHP